MIEFGNVSTEWPLPKVTGFREFCGTPADDVVAIGLPNSQEPSTEALADLGI
jgi:hypothetical protein